MAFDDVGGAVDAGELVLGADGVAVLLLLVLDDVVDHDDGGAVVGDPAGEEGLEEGGVGVGVEVVAVEGHGFGDAVDDDEGAAGQVLVRAGGGRRRRGAGRGGCRRSGRGSGRGWRRGRGGGDDAVGAVFEVDEGDVVAGSSSWRAARRVSQVLPDSDSPETVWTPPS
jgi:hypothetical protein